MLFVPSIVGKLEVFGELPLLGGEPGARHTVAPGRAHSGLLDCLVQESGSELRVSAADGE